VLSTDAGYFTSLVTATFCSKLMLIITYSTIIVFQISHSMYISLQLPPRTSFYGSLCSSSSVSLWMVLIMFNYVDEWQRRGTPSAFHNLSSLCSLSRRSGGSVQECARVCTSVQECARGDRSDTRPCRPC